MQLFMKAYTRCIHDTQSTCIYQWKQTSKVQLVRTDQCAFICAHASSEPSFFLLAGSVTAVHCTFVYQRSVSYWCIVCVCVCVCVRACVCVCVCVPPHCLITHAANCLRSPTSASVLHAQKDQVAAFGSYMTFITTIACENAI